MPLDGERTVESVTLHAPGSMCEIESACGHLTHNFQFKRTVLHVKQKGDLDSTVLAWLKVLHCETQAQFDMLGPLDPWA